MKFVINGENIEREPEIELRLFSQGKRIYLEGRDDFDKSWWNILYFENGKFGRCANCELKGLEKDSLNKIIEF
jgi:hypothetical protein